MEPSQIIQPRAGYMLSLLLLWPRHERKEEGSVLKSPIHTHILHGHKSKLIALDIVCQVYSNVDLAYDVEVPITACLLYCLLC